MEHSEFRIGLTFYCGDGQWRCTDVGTRVITAIRIDQIEVASVLVGSGEPEKHEVLTREQAEQQGWFNGPPYAVAEDVFDEYDQDACSLEPEGEIR